MARFRRERWHAKLLEALRHQSPEWRRQTAAALQHAARRDDIVIYSNAVVFKKAASLLGNFYLEIDPGTPYSVDVSGQRVDNVQLGPDEQILKVVEATTPDELMRRIEQSMPNVDLVLLSVRDLSEDMRRVVNGPMASIASQLDQLVQEERETISRILERTDRTIARIEEITKDIQSVTGGADDKVDRILGSYGYGSGHVFNLGHGISQHTDPENAAALVQAVHELSKKYH